MDSLTKDDLDYCVRRLPKGVRDLLVNDPNLLVAGGFIRSCITREEVNDVDVFAPTAKHAREVAEKYTAAVDGRYMVETDNAFTILGDAVPVQFIHKWTYKSCLEVLGSFDFTIAKAVITHIGSSIGWLSACDERFYADLAGKRLVYSAGSGTPGGSMLRVMKFVARGYRIAPEELAKVMIATVRESQELPRDSVGAGTEEERLVTVLREVDPLSPL